MKTSKILLNDYKCASYCAMCESAHHTKVLRKEKM